MTLSELLSQKQTVILDGAMGTELHRLGVDIGLPLWSANALIRAPHVVRNIHFFYLHAGADIITTNTFRTNYRTIRRTGNESQWEELNFKAVEFAFEARERYRVARPVLIAGGIAPVEDCYSPELVPNEQELRDEHWRQISFLAMTGIDFFLIETMLSISEAKIAAEAAMATGKEFAVSFVTDNKGNLLSGESLQDAIHEIEPLKPTAILVNCVSARFMHIPLKILLDNTRVPLGCYANIGTPVQDGTHMHSEIALDEYVDEAGRWSKMGAKIIGGCCGTTPEFIAGIVNRISPLSIETN